MYCQPAIVPVMQSQLSTDDVDQILWLFLSADIDGLPLPPPPRVPSDCRDTVRPVRQ